MLDEYHVIYSVRNYTLLSVTVVGLGTYQPRIWRSTCTHSLCSLHTVYLCKISSDRAINYRKNEQHTDHYS